MLRQAGQLITGHPLPLPPPLPKWSAFLRCGQVRSLPASDDKSAARRVSPQPANGSRLLFMGPEEPPASRPASAELSPGGGARASGWREWSWRLGANCCVCLLQAAS